MKPRLAILFNRIHELAPDAKLFFHSCGNVRPLLPDFIELGVDILNPVHVRATGMDPVELKRDFGRDIVFWGGGVDTQDVLPNGTPRRGARRRAAQHRCAGAGRRLRLQHRPQHPGRCPAGEHRGDGRGFARVRDILTEALGAQRGLHGKNEGKKLPALRAGVQPQLVASHRGHQLSTRPFYFDAATRVANDVTMRRVLHERYGDIGLGEADPQPRPVAGSLHVAGGFVIPALLGAEVRFSTDAAPQPLPVHADAGRD